ncbi:MAG TPA: choline dehydrogenase [Rhodanobacteraceae bacterium]|nr:choline dehydrogenase [Rhodanobacteraceae bacterium]
MYDYVIVGAGSAGCVLAARLSEDPEVRVCLLEAGPSDDSFFVRMPFGIAAMMRSRQRNWRFRTEPEPNCAGRRMFWPRGRMLGGSSALNAMCYTRGHHTDYDHWASLGNTGWSYAEVLPYFKRFENRERGADGFHGTGGPYNVAELRDPNELSLAFVEAAVETGLPRNDDFNGARQEGAGLYEVMQKDGQRCCNARAFLRTPGSDGMAPVERPNLTIFTGARVTRVLFEGTRAVGVTCRHRSRDTEVPASHEVLLCGGTVNSPQLLLLSGIGPADELARHGIAQVLELPGVGKNLQDHPDVLVVHKATRRVGYSFGPLFIWRAAKGLMDYLARRRGPFTSNLAEAGGFARTSAALDLPDVQYHFLPAIQENHGLTLRRSLGFGFSLHVCVLRPRSRGEIGLKSADPLADPRIQPNYLADPADLRTLVAGVRTARRILAARAFDPYRGRELSPGESINSDAAIADFVRQRCETLYHPVGTCKMGVDAMAVVDPELRVRGLHGLRVVDASIMPTLIGGNTNTPTTMIADKAADRIRQARRGTPVHTRLPQASSQPPAATEAQAMSRDQAGRPDRHLRTSNATNSWGISPAPS